MGQLATAFDGVDGTTIIARNSLAILMAMPLLGIVAYELYPRFSAMKSGQAVVIFGAIGGISGLVSQSIAAGQLERLTRRTNVLELVPAIAASVLASAVATWAFLPPNPNPVTTTLRANGSLPS